MSDLISLSKIEVNNGESYKIKLEGELLRQFKAYELAYEKSYSKKANPEQLLNYLVNFGLNKDIKFKRWYKKIKQPIEHQLEGV